MSDNLKLENGRYWCTLCGKKETTAIKFDAQVVSLCTECIACLVKKLNERLRTRSEYDDKIKAMQAEIDKLNRISNKWAQRAANLAEELNQRGEDE